MARRRRNRSASTPGTAPEVGGTGPESRVNPSGPKLWLFRLIAALFLPLLLLLFLEGVLRIAGFGYATSFLLDDEVKGAPIFVPNDRFEWRYFGSNLARRPAAFAIPQTKAPGTVRVFVFGESAAFGDPQPDFGLPRMLEAILSVRYPSTPFEVVNAAMTGINSHAVVDIARASARAGADVWIVYMGNNEVVGPFGAGTVFGPQVPPLALIRANLTLKRTRSGQLLDWTLGLLRPAPPERSEWRGMLMFLDQPVGADDARMPTVYRHFEDNLQSIVRAGRTIGAGIVLSTVAVNLKDAAPFASELPPGLSKDAGDRWRDLVTRGGEAEHGGRAEEALTLLREAESIGGRAAELQFLLARCYLALGQNTEAGRRFALARDLDRLRFRCDGKLNEITRLLGAGREAESIVLADAEGALARASPDGVPGAQFFYDHVHMTFEGNYLVARTIAEGMAPLLPGAVREHAGATAAWPDAEACARWLQWTDWDRFAAITEMLGRLADPPFTYQLNHAEQVQALKLGAERLQSSVAAALRQAALDCDAALTARPNDAVLHARCAEIQGSAGDRKRALGHARRVTELLAHSAPAWSSLGAALARDEQYGEAERAYREVLRLEPLDFFALQGLAQVEALQGRRDEAMRDYRRVIAMRPRFGMAYFGLGQLLDQLGRKEEAEKNFRLALENRIHRAEELTILARFCQSRGWQEEALANYRDAIRLRPFDVTLHLGAAECLAALGRGEEAERYDVEAVRLAPESGPARFLLARQLGRDGKPAEAAEQFREAVRLMPDVVEARVNLGIALMNQGLRAEALDEFHEVLRRSPKNEIALRYLEKLR